MQSSFVSVCARPTVSSVVDTCIRSVCFLVYYSGIDRLFVSDSGNVDGFVDILVVALLGNPLLFGRPAALAERGGGGDRDVTDEEVARVNARFGTRWSRGKTSMGEIRHKYGSEWLEAAVHLPTKKAVPGEIAGHRIDSNGAPGPIRTADTRFRRAVLCPLSYWGVGGIVANSA